MTALSKSLLCLLTFLYGTFSWASGSIEQVDSIKTAWQQNLDIDADTLVVFDIDEVLLTDQDAILKPVGDALKFRIFNERYMQANSKNEKKQVTAILSIPLKMGQKKLVESITPDWIAFLKNKSAKVIALTSCPTRPFGVNEDFESLRLEQMRSCNIDFSQTFPKQPRIALEQLSPSHAAKPIYHQGVLFAEGFSKADVLCAFLNEVHYTPKKIIFIDDLYCNLQQMKNKLEAKKIPFKGYYYVKVTKDSENHINEKLARFQFDYLFKHKKWLSDKEALKAMQDESI